MVRFRECDWIQGLWLDSGNMILDSGTVLDSGGVIGFRECVSGYDWILANLLSHSFGNKTK